MGFQMEFNDESAFVRWTTEQQCKKALEMVGLQAEGYAQLELETPKIHADGTSRPNVDTGRLVNSITHTTEGYSTAVIGTNVEYAPYVELGTSKSKPYPYLRPAIEKHITEYQALFEAILKSG